MWNWKTVYEDDICAFYCDLDKVIDTEADADDLYASTECYMPLRERYGVWTSLSFKKKTIKKQYSEARKQMGFFIEGYEDYQYSLCLVEFDVKKMKYRIIPVMDYDTRDHEISDSFLFADAESSLVDGISGEWASIRSRKIHPMIKALYKMFSA
jgi:hypothetical protein